MHTLQKGTKRNDTMKRRASKHINSVGNLDDPDVVFVCDSPWQQVWDEGGVMTGPQMDIVREACAGAGLKGNRCAFITCSPPIPPEAAATDARTRDFLALHAEEFAEELGRLLPTAKLVVPFGKTALRMVAGKSVEISKCRGTVGRFANAGEVPVLPLFSPAHVLRKPEVRGVFESDFGQIRALRESGWDGTIFERSIAGAHYEWVTDLSPLLAERPKRLALDTETLGYEWRHGRRILTVQLTWKKGHAWVVPLQRGYFNNPELRGESTRHLPLLSKVDVRRLEGQLRELLGDPRTKVVGHNLKYDLHHLRNHGIEVANWYADTMQLAFLADENMLSKSLDDCARRWVPELGGYADAFNTDPVHQGKSRMDLVPHDKMIRYGGGDTDACFRLCERLVELGMQDERQWTTFRRVQMPGLRTFFEMERKGIRIDRDALRELGTVLARQEQEMYQSLMRQAAAKAPAVLRRHEAAGLSFTRSAFTADLLFSTDGFKLKPIVFTDGTKNLPDEEKIPSTSTKTHLPFFDHIPFVAELIEYQQVQKMRSTYVGLPGGEESVLLKRTAKGKVNAAVVRLFREAGREDELPPAKTVPVRSRNRMMKIEPVKAEVVASVTSPKGGFRIDVDTAGDCWKVGQREPTGFWQYLGEGLEGDIIHPSFRLDNTVTGRSSSQNPNAQNFPKRGKLAKAYRKIFKPRPGFVFIECDLSQAELRIAAWMANDPVMLRIYREGGDIHTMIAARSMGLTDGAFAELPAEERKAARQKAKAVNFGFLYGMWWKKFKNYAKTQYGVSLTDRESEKMREMFFRTFPALEGWHTDMKAFVNRHGFVRSLHGALRRLPDINSNDKGVQQEAERQSVNSPVQRFASDVGIMAMARFGRDCPWDDMFPVAFIHDALVVEAREERAEECAAAMKYCMETVPLEAWFGIVPPLPIVADVSIGTSLGEMEERPDIVAAMPAWFRPELDLAPPAGSVLQTVQNRG